MVGCRSPSQSLQENWRGCPKQTLQEQGRHTGTRAHIMCQDVLNSYFLRLSHQILSSKAWVFSEAASGDMTTGGHTVSPSGTCHTVGTQFWFLLFCFHRSFCSPVGQYHFVLDFPETKTFLLLYEIHLGISGFLKPNQKLVKTKQEQRNKAQSQLAQAKDQHVALFLSTQTFSLYNYSLCFQITLSGDHDEIIQ